MKNIFVLLLASVISTSALSSQIKKRSLDEQNRTSYEYDQFDMIQKDIRSLNERIDNLTKSIDDIKSKLAISAVSESTEPRIQLAKQEEQDINKDKNDEANASEKQVYDLALSALKNRDFIDASKKFEEFINLFPSSEMLSNAHFWYAEAFYKQKIYDRSALQFLKSYKSSPKGPKAHESLIKLAYSLSELGKVKESCSIIKKFKNEFPKVQESKLSKMLELEKTLNCKNSK